MTSSRSMKLIAILGTAACLAACGESVPESAGAPASMRRLTEQQYHNVIHDVFGEQIVVGGQFDPLLRSEGLAAIGAREAGITPAGFERYFGLARSIARQVVAEGNRVTAFPCVPQDVAAADDDCATAFLSEVGRFLYRRPLTDAEINVPVAAARDAAVTTKDFYEGIAFALAGMMVSPKFLFVVEATEPDPAASGRPRLTGFAKASRLSFLLWNTSPDAELLAAAEEGTLHTDDGLRRQVDRMLASPKIDGGVRAFFADFLDFARFETLEKDPVIYPAFNLRASEDAREQLLRTITDHLVVRGLDYRELYTTRRTFMTDTLARIYRVRAGRADGGWTPFEFPEEDPRAGIATQIGFVALHSHPGRSSPTLRGRAVREVLLCQHVPDPPGDVDFSLFTDPNSPNKTARERLTAHSTAAACAGCHKITDPIGLGFEHFDGAGQLRTTENGAHIDVAGELDGKPYSNVIELGQAIHDDPATASCLVNRLYAYGVGRALARDDQAVVTHFEKEFAAAGYRLPPLLRAIALSDAFYAVSEPASAPQTSAENDPVKENRS